MTNLPRPSALLRLAAAVACLVLVAACSPNPKRVCRHLAKQSPVWAEKGDACLDEMESLETALGDTWSDIAICYTRAGNDADRSTCTSAANSVIVGDVCRHVDSLSEGDGLTTCVRRARDLREGAPDEWPELESCLRLAPSDEVAGSCMTALEAELRQRAQAEAEGDAESEADDEGDDEDEGDNEGAGEEGAGGEAAQPQAPESQALPQLIPPQPAGE